MPNKQLDNLLIYNKRYIVPQFQVISAKLAQRQKNCEKNLHIEQKIRAIATE